MPETFFWWIHIITYQSKSLRPSSPQLELYADACLTDWGAAVGTSKTGDHWAHEELDHINCLDLKAILLGLQSLCNDYRHTHIHLRSNNTTAIACLD